MSGIEDTAYRISTSILDDTTTYFWHVKAMNEGGTSAWSEVWSFTTGLVTSVEQVSSDIPNDFRLSQNYPNPFNPTTTIEFDLPKAGFVTLKIYNILGEEVVKLVAKNLQAGKYSTQLDASNLASGVNLYRLQSGSFMQTKKMILAR